MARDSFANMDNMMSSYSIGHLGNLADNGGGGGGGSGLSAYGNMFENREDIVQMIQSLTSKSNIVHILLPAIDQIFSIQSPLVGGLEALGIANYFDPGKAVGGFSLPKPLSLTSNKKDQSRGV